MKKRRKRIRCIEILTNKKKICIKWGLGVIQFAARILSKDVCRILPRLLLKMTRLQKITSSTIMAPNKKSLLASLEMRDLANQTYHLRLTLMNFYQGQLWELTNHTLREVWSMPTLFKEDKELQGLIQIWWSMKLRSHLATRLSAKNGLRLHRFKTPIGPSKTQRITLFQTLGSTQKSLIPKRTKNQCLQPWVFLGLLKR